MSFEGVQAAAQAAVKAFENREFDAVEMVEGEVIPQALQVRATPILSINLMPHLD